FLSPRLGDNGAITFGATVAGAGRKPRSGLFRRDAAGSVAVAATGEPAPGWEGSSYRALLDPVTNAAGSIAFVGLVDPTPPTGTGQSELRTAPARRHRRSPPTAGQQAGDGELLPPTPQPRSPGGSGIAPGTRRTRRPPAGSLSAGGARSGRRARPRGRRAAAR